MKSMKYSTYVRSTTLTLARFKAIRTKVEDLAKEIEVNPITQVQQRRLSSYLTEIRKKRQDFEGNLARILESTDEEIKESDLETQMQTINDLFVEIASQIETIIPPTDPLSPVFSPRTQEPRQEVNVYPHVQLPKLELRSFDGNESDWVNYINLFNSAVHNNSSLSTVIKMQYLLSTLNGEPHNLVKSLNISPANYLIAYNLLQERYSNNRRLVTLNLNSILDLPSVTQNNPKSIRAFLNSYTEHTQSLSALQCDITQGPNPLLVAHLLRKLDSSLCKKLESYRSSQECDPHSLPSLEHIIKFLNSELNSYEDTSLHVAVGSKVSDSKRSTERARKAYAFSATSQDNSLVASHATSQVLPPRHHSQPSADLGRNSSTAVPPPAPACFACRQTTHKIYSCPVFLQKSPTDRSNMVKANKRCYSCLGAHMINDCSSKNVCNVCKRRHHSLLHFDRSAPSSPASSQPSGAPIATTVTHSYLCPSPSTGTTVLLGTALVHVTSPNGNSQVLRCLLDSGSQLSFISERAVQLLHTPRLHSNQEIVGISATKSRTKGLVHLNLSSLSGKVIAAQHPLHILDRISADLPHVRLSPEVWQRTKPYVLADPTFDRPGTVDMLLGGDLYPLLFTQNNYSLGRNMPHLIGTHFGYVVMGTAPTSFLSPPASYFVTLHASADDSSDLHSSLQKFWVQEELPVPSRKSVEEEICDKHFQETHSRTEDGRYVVRLPLKPDAPTLGQSQHIAEKRLYSLERKFKAQPQFHKLYVDFMRDCENSDYMTKVIRTELSPSHCFLPHHGVLKRAGDSAKIRVVYDASCQTSSGHSLNDILLTGPKLQMNICDILLRFRIHNVVFTCDIRKMYLQILVHPSDQQYQMVLWRENAVDPISVYKLTRVTFGVNCSPYLAIRTLHQLAHDEGKDFPEAAAVLKEQIYIDDIVTGSHSVEAAKDLQQQLIQLLSRGHFDLRKWTSNSPELLRSLPETHRDTPVFLETTNEPQFTILGLHWSSESDTFSYQLNLSSSLPTKRSVLSTIAKIYDPCGFLAPCIMLAKCLMQLLWTQNLQWDDPLPPELKRKWDTFVSALSSLTDISIPRALQLSPSACVELHGFADASESGYAAVLYFRIQQPNGAILVHQILAKTRVAPLKRVTLPRLELCAAYLLAQLTSHCRTIFKNTLPQLKYYLWCDSSVTLTWLQTPSYKLKTYVANRVSQAQELVSPSSWRYVPTQHNPADCASRGILASELVSHPLWWTGPPWLSMPPTHWPSLSFTPVDLQSSEEAKVTPLVVLNASPASDWDLFAEFSSWTKLQRVTALLIRFGHNLRHPDKRHGSLRTSELQAATRSICKSVQGLSFAGDIHLLKRGSMCSTRLQRLAPFIDQEGLIRVGGRLRKSSLPFEEAHPILLPKKHKVVDLLVDHYHQVNLHPGPRLTQALICRHYWIFSARQVIRSRIFKCITCFRNKPRNYPPLMGDLPPSRIVPARPFNSTGSDYFGPLQAKIHTLRAVRLIKVYVCIFICMVTKAVHLEVVTDLTTEAFLAALTRFTSRRGLPAHLYSDCGTNFVGADSALRKLVPATKNSEEAQDSILLFSSQRGIQFHFNAPASPHMGGLWESAVRSAKHHLRRVMGDVALPLTELITLTTQVEAILNSRPLTPLSNDPEDCSALTPGHFLIGAPLAAVPEPHLSEVNINRLKRWQLVQALHQRLWKRWQLEYLHTLQQRTKWISKNQNLKIGDLVLVHMNTPPLTWPLARVIAVHPGSDGVVRVVDLKTATGHLTRPAVKVFPLPLN